MGLSKEVPAESDRSRFFNRQLVRSSAAFEKIKSASAISRFRDESFLIIRLDGQLDFEIYKQMEEVFQDACAQGDVRLILDLEAVSYVSSQGWGILISLLKRIREAGGDIKISRMRAHIKQLFYHAGLANIFEEYPGVDQAKAAFEISPI